MKIVFRYIIYSVVIVSLSVACVNIFKYHPEVQFAFIMPGLFILLYSIIRDDIFRRVTSLDMIRGFREK